MGRMKDLSIVLDEIKADGEPIGLEPFITRVAKALNLTRSQAQGTVVYLQNEGLVAFNYETQLFTMIHNSED
jgi:DNA-binding IclR family transcriptional regulator